uniref:RING-type domain-containing protein n=1 Tax=Parascaris univalens TaxID=6257 RepID=A0A915AEK2_PARUN
PIVRFQDNQCRLLNKRIVEIRCKNEQLRTSFMQMAVYKSQLEKQLAVVQGLRPQNESEKGDSGMLQRSLDVSVSTTLSNGKPYRDQKEQQNTPSTLT